MQESARNAGPSPPEEQRKAMSEALAKLQEQAKEAQQNARQLDVPPGNIALFRKYEADIKKYAMSGLEWIGL